MDIDYKEIGRRIALRRKELGLKQVSVCEQCDLSDKYLSGIERARSVPSIEVLMRICHALQTTPNAILLGTTDQNPSDFEHIIAQRLNGLAVEDLKFILSFIDWYKAQRVNTHTQKA